MSKLYDFINFLLKVDKNNFNAPQFFRRKQRRLGKSSIMQKEMDLFKTYNHNKIFHEERESNKNKMRLSYATLRSA